jgi:hypothetical protein
MLDVNAQNIALAGAPQGHFDVADAVDAVGSHPGERHIRSHGPLDHGKWCFLATFRE